MPDERSASAVPLGGLVTSSVALASVGAGVVHLGVAGQHLDHVMIAAAFVAIGMIQIALAGGLVLAPSRGRLITVGVFDLGLLGLWAITRLTSIPFVHGLETAQPIGLADIVVVLMEGAALAAIGVALILPRAAASSLVARGRRVLVGVAGGTLALTVPGLLAPHSHGGSHGAAAHPLAHAPSRPGTVAHGHDSLSFDEAARVLAPHGHDRSGVTSTHVTHPPDGALAGRHVDAPGGHPSAGGHAAGDAAHADHPATGAHQEENARRSVKIVGGEENYFAYEPATRDGSHAAAVRYHDAGGNHHAPAHDCRPSAAQQASADRIAKGTARALEKYHNNPWQALRDGFVAYPIPLWKAFHMVSVTRSQDGRTLDPVHIESFMYAMTDRGLTAIGGMFMYPHRERTPPNPTGCLLVWHQHTGGEGLATSFDPRSPDESVWMAHVWTFGGLDPWGRDFDGTEPHSWFFAYRHLPAVCAEDGECL